MTYLGNAGKVGAGAGRCQFTFQTLHATSQDGSSLELSQPPRVGSAIFRMQGAEGCDAGGSCLALTTNLIVKKFGFGIDLY